MKKQEKQEKKQKTKVIEKDTLLAKLFVFAKQKNETQKNMYYLPE